MPVSENVKNPGMPADGAQQKSALLVATVTSFMGPFMISSVNVALPAIQAEFAVDAVMLAWISTAYLLATAVLLVPIGKIADIYGRNKVFTAGLILYSLSTFLSVLAGSVEMLIFLRIFQGFGAAMFVTTGMAILISVFPPHRRGRAIGFYVAAVYIGLSVGPFAGGVLTQHFGWRSIFWVAAPIGAVSVYITLRYLTGEWADAGGEKLDMRGSLLYVVAIFTLVYGAARLPSGAAALLLAVGFTCLAFFIRYETRIANPVFEIRLFRHNRLFAFSSLAALINYSATFATTFLVSLYLQYIKGMTPQSAGTVLMAQPVVMALLSPLAGRLSDRIEPRLIASAGMAITSLGLLFFIFITKGTPAGLVIGNLALLGLGFALFSSPNMSAIMGAVDRKYYGIASGAVATMRLLGQMTSMATATVIFAVVIGRSPITPANYDLFLHSVRITFAVFAILCSAGVFFSMMRGRIRAEERQAGHRGR